MAKSPTRFQFLTTLGVLLGVPALIAHAGPGSHPPAIRMGNSRAVDFPGLKHVLRLSESLYSGAVPEGDPGFLSLSKLGIRTILTVDGAPPDTETARKYGLRYVHLPFGYDGCPTPQAHRLIRAARDLPGPLYVHCHHGKNRGPTAAALIRIGLDGIPLKEALEVLERAGTGAGYLGLFATIREFRRPTDLELESVNRDFPERVPPKPLVKAMVEIQFSLDLLRRAQGAGWPASDSSLRSAAHQAVQLREGFTEVLRQPAPPGTDRTYGAWMRSAELQALRLEASLAHRRLDEATRVLGQVVATCQPCHSRYRDRPENSGKGK